MDKRALLAVQLDIEKINLVKEGSCGPVVSIIFSKEGIVYIKMKIGAKMIGTDQALSSKGFQFF
jgi:hypothetical protein